MKFPDANTCCILFSQLQHWHCTYIPSDIRLIFYVQPIKQEIGRKLGEMSVQKDFFEDDEFLIYKVLWKTSKQKKEMRRA